MFFKKREPVSHIAVFLGNPGREYENTRHNAGFLAAGFCEKAAGVKINRLKFGSLTATAQIGGRTVFLQKPQTYMNLSGGAVWQPMSFYKIPLSNVIVITDDTSLPAGKLRIRPRGSSGGHNGLRDIIAKCGGEGFPRIRIGVGSPPHEDYDIASWVLAKFTGEDETLVLAAAERAVRAIETILTHGVDRAMSDYNG